MIKCNRYYCARMMLDYNINISNMISDCNNSDITLTANSSNNYGKILF